eukprot:m.89261 g.89261  ORF g.89261 m.89261 type:complete len:57 (+) comp14968_c3_seq1:279-449(+)
MCTSKEQRLWITVQVDRGKPLNNSAIERESSNFRATSTWTLVNWFLRTLLPKALQL